VADPPPAGSSLEAAVVQAPSHIGVDPGVIEWHLQRGARGLVVEGTGAGNVHASLVPGVEAAVAAGVPVVVTSRCWTGAVSPTYGTPGGGHHLAAIGCIAGGDLPTHKARLALSVALGLDPDPDAVRRWFVALLDGQAVR
jgi:L-asparaginase